MLIGYVGMGRIGRAGAARLRASGTRDAFETRMRALFENPARFHDGGAVENEVDFRGVRTA